MTKYRDMNAKLFAQDIFVESSIQKAPLGARWNFNDGRSFVYCKNAAVALAVGTLLQAAAPQANHLNKTISGAHAIGATAITVNIVTTAVTANEYREGFIHINDAAGEGYSYKILQHPAASAAATCAIKIYDSVEVALVDTTSEYSLTKHPNGDVIVYPATAATSIPIGVANRVVTASYYFWAQVRGVCAVLAGGTLVIGNDVIPDVTVPGAVIPGGTTDIVGAIGRVLRANANTEYALVNLAIPGY